MQNAVSIVPENERLSSYVRIMEPRLPALIDATDAATAFMQASKSPATRRAYASDWANFSRWCETHLLGPLPAEPGTVAAYFAALASDGLAASTITRRAAAIRFRHKAAKLEPPTNSEAVKAVLQGIRRTIGTAPLQKAPATAETITAMTEGLEGIRGLRDRAILLLGFAAALRRSEIVALDVEDLESAADGLHVHIRRSKTDQEGTGEIVSIPNGEFLRPVAAINEWLEAANISEGPICLPINKADRVIFRRLSDKTVAQIIKDRAEAAGLDPKLFSGHSLRSGFVTSALENGADILRVMDVTRHKEVRTLKAYDRRAQAFKDHAGITFL